MRKFPLLVRGTMLTAASPAFAQGLATGAYTFDNEDVQAEPVRASRSPTFPWAKAGRR